jgi:4-hydroxy-tetrahydrodipicolinate synthase
MRFRGLFTAMTTPFDSSNEEVDIETFKRHLEWILRAGAEGVVVIGSTGEAPYLDREERRRLLETAREAVNKPKYLIAGTGGTSRRETLTYSMDAQDIGVDAILVITPFYFKPSPRELGRYYQDLNTKIETPILLYNFPATTGINIPPELAGELIDGEGIVGIKDSSGDMKNMIELIHQINGRGTIFCGNPRISIPALIMGADAMILAISNILPRTFSRIYQSIKKGDHKEALEIYWKIYPLIKLLERGGIPTLKYILNKIGFRVGRPRSPLTLPDKIDREEEYLGIINSLEDIK